MAKTDVRFIGKELGQHGSNIYYREFAVFVGDKRKYYRLGDFYVVRRDKSQPICIAEFQLIWENIKDGSKLATVKLYFRPEDTPAGRLPQHGEHELLECERHVPVYCDQVPSWECDGSEWTYGNFAYEQIKRERVNHFKKNESAESSNCPCGSLNNGEKQRRTCIVNVLSFPAYCRYRCCLSLMGCGYSLPKKVLLAKGCFEVDCWNTRVVFSRWKFMHPGIDEFIQAEDVRVPVFKGRPRKRKINNVVNVVNNNNTHNNNNNDSNGIKPLVNEKKIKLEDPIPIIVETKDEKPLITEPVAKPSTSVLPNSNIQATSSVTVSPSVKQSSSIQVSTSLQSSSSADTSPIFNSNFLRKGKSGTVVDEAFLKHESIVSPDSADKSKIMKLILQKCEDSEKFENDVFNFMQQKGAPIIHVPKVGYTRVPLTNLFKVVNELGGYKQVTLSHKWRAVYDDIGLATTITSAATCIRRHYEKLLLPYERFLRNKYRQEHSDGASGLRQNAVTLQKSAGAILSTSLPSTTLATVQHIKSTSKPSPKAQQISTTSSITQPYTLPLSTVTNTVPPTVKIIPSQSSSVSNTAKNVKQDMGQNSTSVKVSASENPPSSGALPSSIVSGALSKDAEKTDQKSEDSVKTGNTVNVSNKVKSSGKNIPVPTSTGSLPLKVIIRKRRGRPTKFLKAQLEQLKSMAANFEIQENARAPRKRGPKPQSNVITLSLNPNGELTSEEGKLKLVIKTAGSSTVSSENGFKLPLLGNMKASKSTSVSKQSTSKSNVPPTTKSPTTTSDLPTSGVIIPKTSATKLQTYDKSSRVVSQGSSSSFSTTVTSSLPQDALVCSALKEKEIMEPSYAIHKPSTLKIVGLNSSNAQVVSTPYTTVISNSKNGYVPPVIITKVTKSVANASCIVTNIQSKTPCTKNNDVTAAGVITKQVQVIKSNQISKAGDLEKPAEIAPTKAGPPPLVPIQVDVPATKPSVSTVPLAPSAFHLEPDAHRVSVKTTDSFGMNKISVSSVMTNFKLMKDSFNVDMFIQPLTNEITQSLEDIRKVVGLDVKSSRANVKTTPESVTTEVSSSKYDHHIKPQMQTTVIHSTREAGIPSISSPHSHPTEVEHSNTPNSRPDISLNSRLELRHANLEHMKGDPDPYPYKRHHIKYLDKNEYHHHNFRDLQQRRQTVSIMHNKYEHQSKKSVLVINSRDEHQQKHAQKHAVSSLSDRNERQHKQSIIYVNDRHEHQPKESVVILKDRKDHDHVSHSKHEPSHFGIPEKYESSHYSISAKHGHHHHVIHDGHEHHYRHIHKNHDSHHAIVYEDVEPHHHIIRDSHKYHHHLNHGEAVFSSHYDTIHSPGRYYVSSSHMSHKSHSPGTHMTHGEHSPVSHRSHQSHSPISHVAHRSFSPGSRVFSPSEANRASPQGSPSYYPWPAYPHLPLEAHESVKAHGPQLVWHKPRIRNGELKRA